MLAPQLRTTALEGRVVLAILVRTDGSVGQVKIEASSGIDLLDAAAVRAAESWRFRPATRDGVATESWAIIPVRFVLP
jgi:protein TonB